MKEYVDIRITLEELEQLDKRENLEVIIQRILKRSKKPVRRKINKKSRTPKKKTTPSPDKKLISIPESVAEEYRLKLVQNATESEKITKANLKVLGYKYYFQYIIWPSPYKFYVADFYLPEFGLVLEIDGGYHDEEAQEKKDKIRESNIKAKGYNIARLTNSQCGVTETDRERLKRIIQDHKQSLVIR